MDQFRITTGDGLNHIMNRPEKVMIKADIGMVKLWDDTVNKYHKCKKVYEEASPEEKEFFWKHPLIAYEIGKYQKGSDNIATVAAEFAFMGYSQETGSILSPENKAIGTGGQNAMRHILLQAFTASRYGGQVAKQSADAHENNIQVDMEKTIFKDYDEADMAVDQRNNAIGRSIGLSNEGKSRLDITRDAVDRFREEGFWIAYKTNSGYELRQVKLGTERYEGYKKALENKDENAKWIHPSNGD